MARFSAVKILALFVTVWATGVLWSEVSQDVTKPDVPTVPVPQGTEDGPENGEPIEKALPKTAPQDAQPESTATVEAKPRPEFTPDLTNSLFGLIGQLGNLRLGETLVLKPIPFANGQTDPDGIYDMQLELLGSAITANGAAQSYGVEVLGTGSKGEDRATEILALFEGYTKSKFRTAKVTTGPIKPKDKKDVQTAEGTTPDTQVVVQIQRLYLLPDGAKDWKFSLFAPQPNTQIGFYNGAKPRVFAMADTRTKETVRSTIDVWVSPEWQERRGYDPAIFTLGGADTTRLALHITDDRAGVALWDGSTTGYFGLEYDFTAQKAYHIQLHISGKQTRVVIDGETLETSIPVGLGKTPATQLTLGGTIEGLDMFTGRIAGFRMWGDSLDPLIWDQLYEGDDYENIHAPLRKNLVWALKSNSQSSQVGLQNFAALETPIEGWWSFTDGKSLRIHNRAAFDQGLEPPLFSQTQQAYADQMRDDMASINAGNNVEDIANAADTAFHPHFATGELLQFHQSDALDAADYALPDGFKTDLFNAFRIIGSHGFALHVSTDDLGVTGIKFEDCDNFRILGRASYCLDENQDADVSVFHPDEYIRGLSWTQSPDSVLQNLVVYTSTRTLGPYGATAGDPDIDQREYAMMLPDGTRPRSATIYAQVGPHGLRPSAIGLNIASEALLDGVTLYSDTGSAMRYFREDETTFASVEFVPTLYRGLGGTQGGRHRLTMIDGTRVALEGITRELSLINAHPPTNPKTGFNDTFVSLSKAVNLQANYTGYDILKMDPLHLTDTGTERPIFAQPDGDSTDYYDANRIFVPRGLTYRPEFTGRHNATMHSSDTYSEFRDSFSNTVSLGVNGKLTPVTFSGSLRMVHARTNISESKISKTMGITRAVFYDLILDKSQIDLDAGFVEEVTRLQETGHYDIFLDMFGTHYPGAVVYGGLGVLEIDTTEKMRETLREQGIGIKLEASILLDAVSETRASVGFEHDEEHSQRFRSVVGSQAENFYWIGGTHAGAEHSSWSVGPEGVVPVHVALRPIHELLSPVFFEDQDIYVRVAAELKQAMDARFAQAAQDLPLDQDDPIWSLEVRLDGVACTTDPASSDLVPGQEDRPSSGAVTLAERQFPMIFFAAQRRDLRYLRNYVDGYGRHVRSVDDLPSEPLTLNCPSQENMFTMSPYLQNHNLARFKYTQDDLLGPNSQIEVFDRRDMEHWVVFPPLDATKVADKSVDLLTRDQTVTDVALEILTGGLGVAIKQAIAPDQVTNQALDTFVRPPQPSFQTGVMPIREALAAEPFDPNLRLTADVLKRIEGRWFEHSMVLKTPECTYCEPRRIDFSVRVFQ